MKKEKRGAQKAPKKKDGRRALALTPGSVLQRIALLETPIKRACDMLRYAADNTDIDEENGVACHNIALWLESVWSGSAAYVPMPLDVVERMETYEHLLRACAKNAGSGSPSLDIKHALELSPLPAPNVKDQPRAGTENTPS